MKSAKLARVLCNTFFNFSGNVFRPRLISRSVALHIIFCLSYFLFKCFQLSESPVFRATNRVLTGYSTLAHICLLVLLTRALGLRFKLRKPDIFSKLNLILTLFSVFAFICNSFRWPVKQFVYCWEVGSRLDSFKGERLRKALFCFPYLSSTYKRLSFLFSWAEYLITNAIFFLNRRAVFAFLKRVIVA